MITDKIKKWWQSFRYYVVIDPADNSVTLSKRLFCHIKDNSKGEKPSVFVFSLLPENDTFAFMLHHGINKPTQLCDIQYNDKYKCIGFETLCPSVGAILYKYGLPPHRPVKLSVSIWRTGVGQTYYQFDKPNAEYIRKHT